MRGALTVPSTKVLGYSPPSLRDESYLTFNHTSMSDTPRLAQA
jgi:hypothetical protein